MLTREKTVIFTSISSRLLLRASSSLRKMNKITLRKKSNFLMLRKAIRLSKKRRRTLARLFKDFISRELSGSLIAKRKISVEVFSQKFIPMMIRLTDTES